MFRLISSFVLVASSIAVKAEELAVTGQIVAAQSQEIVAPRSSSWQIQIKWLKEEGSNVEPGDVVAIFDGSTLETEVEQKKSSLEEKHQQRVNDQITEQQNILNAELELHTAQVNYRKALLDSQQPKQLINAMDYEKYQLAAKKAELAVKTAELKLKNSKEEQAKKLVKIDLEISDLERELKTAERQLEKMEVKANLAGPIIYKSDWWGNKFQVGDNAQFGQRIATIPQMNQLQVEALVADVDVHKVEIGQPVNLVFDAYPSQSYPGKVVAINSNGENKAPLGEAKYYPVYIEFEKVPQLRLVAGMSLLGVINL